MLTAPANAAAGKGISAGTLNTINIGQVPGSFFRGSNGETTTIPPFWSKEYKCSLAQASACAVHVRQSIKIMQSQSIHIVKQKNEKSGLALLHEP
jgi:hypothetical protein